MFTVNITTIPSRIDRLVHETLPVLAKSGRVERICIYVPKAYVRFPRAQVPKNFGPDVVPVDAKLAKKIEVVTYVSDMGPLTKYFAAAEHHRTRQPRHAMHFFCHDDSIFQDVDGMLEAVEGHLRSEDRPMIVQNGSAEEQKTRGRNVSAFKGVAMVRDTLLALVNFPLHESAMYMENLWIQAFAYMNGMDILDTQLVTTKLFKPYNMMYHWADSLFFQYVYNAIEHEFVSFYSVGLVRTNAMAKWGATKTNSRSVSVFPSNKVVVPLIPFNHDMEPVDTIRICMDSFVQFYLDNEETIVPVPQSKKDVLGIVFVVQKGNALQKQIAGEFAHNRGDSVTMIEFDAKEKQYALDVVRHLVSANTVDLAAANGYIYVWNAPETISARSLSFTSMTKQNLL